MESSCLRSLVCCVHPEVYYALVRTHRVVIIAAPGRSRIDMKFESGSGNGIWMCTSCWAASSDDETSESDASRREMLAKKTNNC